MGERRLLFPDVSWWKEARVLDNGALFWSAASREEPDWTRDFCVEVDLYGVSDLRLGRAFAVRVQLSQGVTVEALRWGGRTLEQKAPDVFEVPPLSPQNAVSVLPLEADLRDAQGNAATVQRRVPLPLCAAMWRASREDPWTIAGRGDLWNSTQGREWRLWGAWDAGARLCEGSVPFDVVPTRSHTLRPPQAWGAPISVREAPYGAENTRLVLCGSAREGGALAGVKRTAVSQVDVEMRHEIEPSEGHQVLVWGKGGAFSAAWGGAVLQVGTRWMVPFSFQNAQAPVLAVGLAYEGTWLGAWFARDWRELRPVKWDGERAARFALWARWMRLPWREHAATFHELSREWPTDTLLSWLDPAPENRHDLRMGAPASDLIRAVFRGHFQGDYLAAKELVALWKAPPLQLLGALAETDPFLMVAFARKWAKNFAPGAFAALLKNGAKKLDAPSDNPTEGATIALAAWRHMQTLALHLYEHQSISDEGDRELRIGLNDPALRRRVAALLLQTLADDLIT